MKYKIHLQNATKHVENIPTIFEFQRWVNCTLQQRCAAVEIGIRIVEQHESEYLNSTYRKKTKPTNVLSFPYTDAAFEAEPVPTLGDLVICADIVTIEATQQHKELKAHWAHMVVHGLLHLLGYDHETIAEAEKMEALEIEILQKLNMPNPYIEREINNA